MITCAYCGKRAEGLNSSTINMDGDRVCSGRCRRLYFAEIEKLMRDTELSTEEYLFDDQRAHDADSEGMRDL